MGVLVLIALAVDVCLENNPPQRKLANFEDWKWLHIGESIDGGSVEFTEASKKVKREITTIPLDSSTQNSAAAADGHIGSETPTKRPAGKKQGIDGKLKKIEKNEATRKEKEEEEEQHEGNKEEEVQQEGNGDAN